MASSADLALGTVGTVGEAKNAIGNTLTVIGKTYQLPITDTDRRQLDSARVALEAWYAELRLQANNLSYRDAFEKRRYLITNSLKLVRGIADVVKLRDEASFTSFVTGLPAAYAEALGYTARKALEGVGAGVASVGGSLLSGLGLVGSVVLALVVYVVFARKAGRA